MFKVSVVVLINPQMCSTAQLYVFKFDVVEMGDKFNNLFFSVQQETHMMTKTMADMETTR